MLNRNQVLVGVLFWVLVAGAFVALAGVSEFVETLTLISGHELGLILLVVALGLIAMGSVLYVIGRSVDLGFSPIESILLNTTVSLAHNLTPFGQAGGAPIGAAILAQRTERAYEECLAVLSAKDVVSFVPAVIVFVLGGPYLAFYEGSVPPELRPVFALFTAAVLIVCATALGIRRYPATTRRALKRVAAVLNRPLGRVPIVPDLDERELEERLDSFANSLGGVAADRRTVVVASALATTAIFTQGCLLWLALRAVGVDISIVIALFAVPVSLLASALPLPGGTGGVESVQVLILVAVAGATTTPIITAVVLSRGLVYWTPIVLGSVTLVGLGIDDLRS